MFDKDSRKVPQLKVSILFIVVLQTALYHMKVTKNTAIRLYALRNFTDNGVRRTAGDESRFDGMIVICSTRRIIYLAKRPTHMHMHTLCVLTSHPQTTATGPATLMPRVEVEAKEMILAQACVGYWMLSVVVGCPQGCWNTLGDLITCLIAGSLIACKLLSLPQLGA